jgi:hypothetical protein
MPTNTVVMAFSLSPEASAYVQGAGRGRKSAMVNRCILYYKDNRVEELLEHISFMEANIAALQKRLLDAGSVPPQSPPGKLQSALLHIKAWILGK